MDIIIYTTPEKLLHKQDKLEDDPDKSDEGCYYWEFRNMPKIKRGEKVYFATKGFIRGYFIVEDINSEEETDDPMGIPTNSISWLSNSWKDITPIPCTHFQGFKYANKVEALQKGGINS